MEKNDTIKGCSRPLSSSSSSESTLPPQQRASLEPITRHPSSSRETVGARSTQCTYTAEEKPSSQHLSADEKTFTIRIQESNHSPDQDHNALEGTNQVLGPDLEAQNTAQIPSRVAKSSSKITFSGPHDPANPKIWSSQRKWAITACIAAFTFMSPLASTMIAPALPQISQDFGIVNPFETQIVLSIFVLAFAIGPMLLGPLSELYGRVAVSQGSNVFFLIFNAACGFAQNKQQLMAFRFLSGLGGSAPLAIGGAVFGDIFQPEERGEAMGLYAMGPLLGPAIGPIVGGWVTEKSTWRWRFWASSIVNVFILLAGFMWFRETYAPFLLHRMAKKRRQDTGDAKYHADSEGDLDQPVWKKVTATVARPFGMLYSQPIAQVMALYMGFSYGIMYLMISTFPQLFMHQYNESVSISGMNYISIGLGCFIGAPIIGRSNDAVYQKLKERSPQKQGKPEYRMPLIIPFSFLVPVGLLIYGWSAQAKTHWIVPNIGAFVFAIGTVAAFQSVTTFLVDTYTRFAASAIAAVTILRSLMGFAFPLFAPYMFQSLKYGWGNTVLAIAALVVGMPVPILLWIFGEKLRARSSIARGARPPASHGPPVVFMKEPGAFSGPAPPGGPILSSHFTSPVQRG